MMMSQIDCEPFKLGLVFKNWIIQHSATSSIPLTVILCTGASLTGTMQNMCYTSNLENLKCIYPEIVSVITLEFP